MLREYVEMFAESSQFVPGRVNYAPCPECGIDKKLMVVETDEGTLFAKCLRASCAVQTSGQTARHRTSPAGRGARTVVPKLGTRPMSDRDVFWLETHVAAFGAFRSMTQIRSRVARRGDAVVYRMQGRLGEHLADVERWYDGRSPKSKTHVYAPEGALCHWEHSTETAARPSLVVVEDIPSAIGLVLAVPTASAVALCGTHMPRECALDIRKQQYEQVLICLDRDATETARRIRHQWGAVLGTHVRVVPLDLDLKNMTPAAIRQWWERVR